MGGNWVRVWVLPGEGGGRTTAEGGAWTDSLSILNHVLLENS